MPETHNPNLTSNPELWIRLRDFSLDNPSVAFTFTSRLARENGWSLNYAKRVVEEYKKFIFLCCVSQTGVTPSDPVDQAWHLHLTYTKSYWTDLCKNILQKEIHHNPTKGGTEEFVKFDGYYSHTHKLYFENFGVLPPSDIWQNNEQRFSDIHFQRVNVKQNWVIRKPSLKWFLPLALLPFSALFIGAANMDNLIFIVFLVIFGVAVLITIVKKKVSSSPNQSSGGIDSGDDISLCSDSGHGSSGHGDSGCSSGCSGCSSGCSGCGGGD